MPTELVAVTGGIGSGKTVVSKVLMAMGYEVYDCDSRAKIIMDTDPVIPQRISIEIDPSALRDGALDRRRLSQIVFSDAEKLKKLNDIVHGAVKEDLTRWRAEREGTVFVETAILYESGLDRMVDAVWEVTAPTELRVSRVMMRSGLPEDEVRARIKAQEMTVAETPHPHLTGLINDGVTPLLPQIETALQGLKGEQR